MLIKVALFACSIALCAAIPIIFKPFSTFYKGTSLDNGYQNSWQRVRFFNTPTKNFKHEEPHYLYPHYEFEYAVSDKKHGDHKRHYEHRNGDKVYGEYSLIEPGGSLRRVKYNADDENGFNAVVYHHASRHGAQGHSCAENTGYYHQSDHTPETMQHHEHKENKEKPVNEKSEDIAPADNSIADQKENEKPKETMEKELSSNDKQKVSFSTLMLVGPPSMKPATPLEKVDPPMKPATPLEKDMANDQTQTEAETKTSRDEQKPLDNSGAAKSETMPMTGVSNSMEDSKDSQVASSRYRPHYFYDIESRYHR